MPDLQFSLRLRGGIIPRHMENILRRVADLRPAMERSLVWMLRHIEREFATETWESPSGPRPWPSRKPFGDRALMKPPLGDVLGAWRRARRVATQRTAALVPAGAGARYLEWHRGGGQSKIRLADRIWKAKTPARTRRSYDPSDPQYWAMWWRVFLSYGVALSVDAMRERGIHVPVRPHATRSPALTLQLRQTIAQFVAEGRTSGA